MCSLSQGTGRVEKALPKCAAHVFRYFPLNFQLTQALCPHLARLLSPKIPFSMKRPWVCISLQFKEQILLLPSAAGAGVTSALLGAYFGHRLYHSRRKGHVSGENNLLTQLREALRDKGWWESQSQENVACLLREAVRRDKGRKQINAGNGANCWD